MIQTIKTSTMVAIVVVIVRVIGVIMMIMMTMTIITLATIVSINNSDDDDDDDDDGDDDHHHHHHHHRHVKPKALQLCFRQHVTCGRQVVHVIFLFEGACLSIISAYSPQLPDTGNSEISEVTIFSILSVSIAPTFKAPMAARYLDELARMRRSMALPAVSIQFPEARVWKWGMRLKMALSIGKIRITIIIYYCCCYLIILVLTISIIIVNVSIIIISRTSSSSSSSSSISTIILVDSPILINFLGWFSSQGPIPCVYVLNSHVPWPSTHENVHFTARSWWWFRQFRRALCVSDGALHRQLCIGKQSRNATVIHFIYKVPC